MLREQRIEYLNHKTGCTTHIAKALLIGAVIAVVALPVGALGSRLGIWPFTGGFLLLALSQVTQLWQFWAIWLALGVVNAAVLYEACFAIITVTVGAQAKRAITLVTLFAGFANTICFPSAYLLCHEKQLLLRNYFLLRLF